MMETKVKEEISDKEYGQNSTPDPRRNKLSGAGGKERRSPESEDARTSPAASPLNNGSNESSSPPPMGACANTEARTAAGSAGGALLKLRRFLSTLHQFAAEMSLDAGDRVRALAHSLVVGAVTVEEFQSQVQECTNYPLRASVPGFLRALLPHVQRDLLARARHAKQVPLLFIRSHEHLVLEACSGEAADIFAPQTKEPTKRRASDPFFDAALPQTNGSHIDAIDYPPSQKRPNLLLNPSPFLYPLPNPALFDYPHYHGYHAPEDRKDGGITVRDVSSMNSSFQDPRMNLPSSGASTSSTGNRNDDEWKNINTMLNCILSMVEKTKRALAILQQRGVEPPESSDIKRVASEIMAATVRQTEERVAEVRRRAEDAVNQVKRQALAELGRAAGAAEGRALELVAAERAKLERLLGDRKLSPPPAPAPPPPASTAPPSPPAQPQHQNACWNCGRKAQETCSGCNSARYCGAFCQHKDWENHHQVCAGREQKTTAVLTTSPPGQGKLPRSSTPKAGAGAPHAAPPPPHTVPAIPLTTIIPPTPERITENRLSLTTLNNAERTITTSSDRIALTSLSTAQSLIGGIGGKK